MSTDVGVAGRLAALIGNVRSRIGRSPVAGAAFGLLIGSVALAVKVERFASEEHYV